MLEVSLMYIEHSDFALVLYFLWKTMKCLNLVRSLILTRNVYYLDNIKP